MLQSSLSSLRLKYMDESQLVKFDVSNPIIISHVLDITTDNCSGLEGCHNFNSDLIISGMFPMDYHTVEYPILTSYRTQDLRAHGLLI